MARQFPPVSKILIMVMAVLAVGVLISDCLFPIGVAVEMAYLPVVLVALWLPRQAYIYLFSALCAAFTVIGHFYSGTTSVGPVETDNINRLFALVSIAVITLLSVLYRQASEALRKVNEELEERVKSRTRDLEEAYRALRAELEERKKLEEAKRHAEQLAVIGTMSAKLAHEIRNPLNSVLLNVSLMGRLVKKFCPQGGDEGETSELLQSIDSEVRRIHRVTDEYLRLARVSKPRLERIALNDLLTQGLAFMKLQFEKSRVQVETRFESGLPAVEIDKNQIWQVTLNLIGNALEAMPDGGSLNLSTARENGEVVLTIADTGWGITEEVRREIFRPFFTTKANGTGLGLPIAQQIITEHRGRIECESQVGKGTRFIIHLPQAEGRADGTNG